MAKKSITNEEIGLIKSMLSRRMKNRDIQFYFNRQDRPVNSGRITQIRDKSYGPEVPTATDEALDRFLKSFTPATIGAVVKTVHPPRELTFEERAAALFEQRGRLGWFLRSHEDEASECKETFCLKPEGRFADALRSIAGLANNGGGFLFFGIRELPDGALSVAGLADTNFSETDPSEINRCLAGVFAPVPVFRAFTIDVGGKLLGVLRVEKHELPPVMAIKNIGNEVKEGAIYYRYVGETRVIKPAELHHIIAYREQRAVSEFSRKMARVAIGSSATLDLDTGAVEGNSGGFLIDEDLLPKIQFIRQGEFSEQEGAPTLRLVGDVSSIPASNTKTVRNNITNEATLLAFLKKEPVEHPIQYVLQSAHTSRKWLPIFYYAHATGQPLAAVVAAFKAETPTYKGHHKEALRRLEGTGTGAFYQHEGKAKTMVAKALDGTLVQPAALADVTALACGIQGISDGSTVNFDWLKALLVSAYDFTHGDTSAHRAARSHVYRAACRLDELEYEPLARSRG